MQSEYLGALDIGGTKIVASIAGRDGPLARVTAPTPKSGPRRALGDQCLALLEQACRQCGIQPGDLARVGVASCGPFLHVDGDIELVAPNICGGQGGAADLPNDWTSVPLQSVLRERHADAVIENDCVSALIAERALGAVQDEPNCVYVTWSTGVGFGLCVDGRVLHGKNGNAGHAGHLLMSESSDALCGCGNRGDLEGLISGRNIAAIGGRPAPELFDAARRGEEPARSIAAGAARWFGRALYNLTAALDVSVFVAGGSVWANHGDWLGPLAQREIASRFPALTEGVTIVPAGLEKWVADIGAFCLVMPDDWIAHWRETQPWLKA
ncbi:glucokinase [Noviherbaspirillum humi]|uniref:Glucokinase n=1 Tax=Noviherbaspirillum humi TaxID=1688639 RepID=A0A239HD07_9BURK|nr:ROK family protein [Noviherbaspirillum humi]SNS79045.1 glucokinase [Noviherbaspirillum humi]